jgi:hypothetical protein
MLSCLLIMSLSEAILVALGVLMVSVFAIGPKTSVFKPDRERRIFNGYKIRSTTFLGREI